MALADNLGGTATIANLKPGQSTTTIESKTNFFAAVPIGETAYAECVALHRGRSTMVWQTRVTRADGRLCALVTQTQMVLEREEIRATRADQRSVFRRSNSLRYDGRGAKRHQFTSKPPPA